MRVTANEGLYGEEAAQGSDFRFHCETLFFAEQSASL